MSTPTSTPRRSFHRTRTYGRTRKVEFVAFHATVNRDILGSLGILWGTQAETGRVTMSLKDWNRARAKGGVVIEGEGDSPVAVETAEPVTS